ncbi:histone H1-like [Fagus crenata]
MAKASAATATKNTKNKPTHHSDSTLHPPYFEMISEAILTLKDRTGSSQQAIAKFIEDKYKQVLPTNFKKVLSVQLKKFVKSERLVKIKNSFKVSSTEKLKLAVKETQKKKGNDKAKKAVMPKEKVAKKISEKRLKTKRLLLNVHFCWMYVMFILYSSLNLHSKQINACKLGLLTNTCKQ